MSVQVPCCPVELTSRLDSFEIVYLNFESVSIVGELFPHCGRGGTLSMGPAQHWDVTQLSRCFKGERLLKAFELREQHIIHTIV